VIRIYRYFDELEKPIFDLLEPKPRVIVEVGVFKGWNTIKIINYLKELPEDGDKRLIIVDPVILPEVRLQESNDPELVDIYNYPSLEILPKLDRYDVIILDGDHNYYTLLKELQIIDAKFKGEPPLIFVHDTVENRYRDFYFNVKAIPKRYVHQTHIANGPADYAGGSFNGLIPAVEDFLDLSERDWHWVELDRHNPGVGMLYTVKE